MLRWRTLFSTVKTYARPMDVTQHAKRARRADGASEGQSAPASTSAQPQAQPDIKPWYQSTGSAAGAGHSKRPKQMASGKPAPQKFTQPTVLDDGFTAHPPSIIYKQFGEPVLSSKVAAFDFDGTLISSRSGRSYAVSVHDWCVYNEAVIPRLEQYHQEGYRIVVFTNQGGIKSAMAGATSAIVRGKISNFMKLVPVPVLVMMATNMDDDYRKPGPGMWRFLCQHLSGGVEPDVSESFFVGDNNRGADEGFAASVGLPYRTEVEEFGPPGPIPALPRA